MTVPSDFGSPRGKGPWLTRLAASARFQAWAARFPLTRRKARREGEAMFDLVAGFVHSQSLLALVELGTLDSLLGGPRDPASLAKQARVPPERMMLLLRAGVALGLMKIKRDRFNLTVRGASLMGVPGLADMVRHHRVFYRDLEDPVAFFRGEVKTELADFWPYVFGAAGGTIPEDEAARYSDLMARSQLIVAQDTLASVPLKNVSHLLDVGGGTGAFLAEVGSKHRHIKLTLFDLPVVARAAKNRFDEAGLAIRASIETGSFREDPLPRGADAISLVRVCYDHADSTVAALLKACFDALPDGGKIIISEPMTGGNTPKAAGDVYFALYTLAMRTGRTRSQDELVTMCRDAGFSDLKAPVPSRAFVTSVVIGTKNNTTMMSN